MRKYGARETELAGSLKRIALESPLPGMYLIGAGLPLPAFDKPSMRLTG